MFPLRSCQGLALVAKDEKKYRDLSVRSREEVRKLESCCQDTDKRGKLKPNPNNYMTISFDFNSTSFSPEILRLWQEAWSFLKLANDIADIAWPAREEVRFFLFSFFFYIYVCLY